MNRKVLLIEPNYKNKYPPMGLMKLATYYALSNYASAKSKQEASKENLSKLKIEAVDNLRELAKEEVQLADEVEEKDFISLSL